MPGQSIRRWVKIAVALGFTVLFSAIFIRAIDVGATVDALAAANYLYVVPALGLFAISVGARSLRWQLLYLPEWRLSVRRLLPSLLVGYAGNNLLPLRAGELLRAQHISDSVSVPRMVTFGTFIIERLFDFMVLSTFVLWGTVLVGKGGAYLGIALLLAGLTAAGLMIGVVVANNPGIYRRFVTRPLPLLPEFIHEELASLSESFFQGFSCLTSASRFVAVAVVTAAAWGLELGMYWVLSAAFDLQAGFITIAFAGAAANVALSLPAAQGGVGPFHAAAREALAAFSVPVDSAAAYVVALHIFLIVPVSLVGLAVLWRFRNKGEEGNKEQGGGTKEAVSVQ